MDSNSDNPPPPLSNNSSSEHPRNNQIFSSALLVDHSEPSSPAAMPSPSTSSADSSILAVAGSTVEPFSPSPSDPAPSETQPQAGAQPKIEDPEPRHCWICLTDEGIDSPPSEEWRSPCACQLVAHESCLLEWISDLQTADGTTPVIQCPQCRTPIKIDRETEFLVLLDQFVRSLFRHAMLPGGIMMGIGVLYSGSMVYGFNTIEAIFGEEETRNLLRQAPQIPQLAEAAAPVLPRFGQIALERLSKVIALLSPFVPKASKNGLFWIAPMIAPALLLSRTSLADGVFNALPIPYLIYHHFISPHPLSLMTWPPTPGLAIIAIPYIREIYNSLYFTAFGPHIKRWHYATQRRPREGETAEDIARRADIEAAEEEHMLDIQIELIEEPEVELDANGLPIVPAPAVPPAQAQVVGDVPPQAAAANGAAPAQPAAAANGEPAQAGDNWGFRRNISIFQLARTVVATLFFPAMSSIAGDVLLRTLPKTWVTKPSIPLAASISLSSIFGGEKGAAAGTWRKGLLQEKWGRTLVGGATLILMKDAVHLYVLWRRAKLEGGRRVFDYDKKRKVYLRNGMVARDEN